METKTENAAGPSAPASGSRPRRRVRLELDLGADSRAKMADWLEDIAGQIRRGELNGDAVGGGYSVGYWLELTERPEITHESYFAALAAFNSANTQDQTAAESGSRKETK